MNKTNINLNKAFDTVNVANTFIVYTNGSNELFVELSNGNCYRMQDDRGELMIAHDTVRATRYHGVIGIKLVGPTF